MGSWWRCRASCAFFWLRGGPGSRFGGLARASLASRWFVSARAIWQIHRHSWHASRNPRLRFTWASRSLPLNERLRLGFVVAHLGFLDSQVRDWDAERGESEGCVRGAGRGVRARRVSRRLFCECATRQLQN